MLSTLWRYRGFIVGSVKREFQSKYSNSLLGLAWTFLNPLAMIIVYTVIFSNVMRARQPGMTGAFAYSIYLCAGVLTWGFFAEVATRAQNVFIENANLMKKLNFPRLCLPAIALVVAAVNFAIVFGMFTAFLMISGNFPGWTYLGLFPLIVIQVVFSIGLGVLLGVLNVFFRDVGQLFAVLLQFWFWLTPIVYSPEILPEAVRPLLQVNPMAALIVAYQDVLVKAQWPDWSSLAPVTLLAAVLSVLALRMFRKHAGDIVDEL